MAQGCPLSFDSDPNAIGNLSAIQDCFLKQLFQSLEPAIASKKISSRAEKFISSNGNEFLYTRPSIAAIQN